MDMIVNQIDLISQVFIWSIFWDICIQPRGIFQFIPQYINAKESRYWMRGLICPWCFAGVISLIISIFVYILQGVIMEYLIPCSTVLVYIMMNLHEIIIKK